MVFHLDRFCFCTSAFPVCDRYLNLPRFIGRCKQICSFFLCSFPLYFITPKFWVYFYFDAMIFVFSTRQSEFIRCNQRKTCRIDRNFFFSSMNTTLVIFYFNSINFFCSNCNSSVFLYCSIMFYTQRLVRTLIYYIYFIICLYYMAMVYICVSE